MRPTGGVAPGASRSLLRRREESAAFLRRLMGWIENEFGGLPFDTGSKAEVVTASALNRRDLQRLFRHDATAVHVKGFYPRDAATELGRRLSERVDAGGAGQQNWKVTTGRGLESSDVVTLGEHPPFNVVASQGSDDAKDSYFDGVLRELEQRRFPNENDACSSASTAKPELWPLDLLRLRLDEVWPYGAGLAREEEGDGEGTGSGGRRPFGGGLPRVMKGPTRWKKGYVHVDEMGPLDPSKGLFSANIYLQLPDSSDIGNSDGGRVIDIWPVGVRSRWDWYRNAVLLSGLSTQDAEAQVRLRAALGDPAPFALPVEPGDLVLLCVQRPHAAVGFGKGTRVSLQCFLQYDGPKERLKIDC